MASDKRKRHDANFWTAVGAVVLVLLLLFWLTMADFLGDTDVAMISLPVIF